MRAIVVSVEAQGLEALFRGYPQKLRASLLRVMKRLAIELQGRVKGQKLSGQVLKVRTGTLRRSINQRVEESPGGIEATVGTNVSYAAIHEFGGRTPAHVIRAKKARFLAFPGRDGMVFRKEVNHPGSVIPERSFLRSALKEMAPKIERDIAGAANEALRA